VIKSVMIQPDADASVARGIARRARRLGAKVGADRKGLVF
jgi:hypothetical protein